MSKGIFVHHCVWEDVPDYIRHWGELYGHYSNGFLLTSGGVGEQPEWYLKVMNKFASAYNQASEEKRESLSKKQ